MVSRILIPAVVVLGIWVYVSPPGPKAATAVVSQSCSAAVPGAATVTLAWPAPPAGARETWLDVGLASGFPPGSYRANGPLAPTQTAYALDGVPQRLTYHYRVQTRYDEGWRTTASGAFVSRCPS